MQKAKAKTKRVVKKTPATPKVGQYFKGMINNYPVTGRISESTSWYSEHAKTPSVVFNNFSANEDVDVNIEFGFDDSADISSVQNLELITKRQHNSLINTAPYKSVADYDIRVIKGVTKDKDLFQIGCGALFFRRRELENFLKNFNKIGGIKKAMDFYRFINDIEREDTFDEQKIKAAKELLKFKL